MASRVSEYVSKIPFVTCSLIILNCTVHIVLFFSVMGVSQFAISAKQVLQGEYYRIVSSAFVHGGILHIFMNMSSLLTLGSELESKFGSLKFGIFTVWSILICGTLYVFLSWSLSNLLNSPYQLVESSVGYSGVLFSYAVIEAYHTLEPTQVVFGMFRVPSRTLPFLLLILIQVLVPNVSLLGHLSGVIVGLGAVAGISDVIVPSGAFLSYLESDVRICVAITRLPGYRRCTQRDMGVQWASGSSHCAMVWVAVKTVCDVVAVICHVLGIESCCEALSKCWSSLRSPFSPLSPSSHGAEDSLLVRSNDSPVFRGSSRPLGGAPLPSSAPTAAAAAVGQTSESYRDTPSRQSLSVQGSRDTTHVSYHAV